MPIKRQHYTLVATSISWRPVRRRLRAAIADNVQASSHNDDTTRSVMMAIAIEPKALEHFYLWNKFGLPVMTLQQRSRTLDQALQQRRDENQREESVNTVGTPARTFENRLRIRRARGEAYPKG
jgi:hypothetical protein